MGLFVLESTDKPESQALRQSVRPRHLAYAQSLGDTLLVGGPFLDENDRMIGSLLIVKADSLAEAEAIVANDPYVQAGLFSETRIRPWKWTVNAPEGL